MTDPTDKRCSAPADRNKDAILAVLRDELPAEGLVLEVASGTGQHAVHFAAALPGVVWQPTDPTEAARASVRAYLAEASVPNVRPPLALDVHDAEWPVERAAAVFCANMIHIAPGSAAPALIEGAARVLSADGPLLIYGPFRWDGDYGAESNREFEAWLQARNPAFGIRDVTDLDACADAAGFERTASHVMPANNHLLVYRRRHA